MITTIIAAVTTDRAIGRGGNLIYHISADLRRFKALTVGHTVIMGRKTFESLPKGALPDRRNIVVTRTAGFTAPGIETAPSLTDALDMARKAGETETFIIGGGMLYDTAMPHADRLQLTTIEATAPDADIYFPEIDPARWTLTAESASQTDDKTGVTYRFLTLDTRP